MIKVNFPTGVEEVKINPLYQWDYNQKLAISGVTGGGAVLQAHFYNRFSKEAIRRLAYLVNGEYEVNVPNRILKEKYDVYAVLYVEDYELARDVTFETKGTYYTRAYLSATQSYSYTPVTLPAGYVTGTEYYRRTGSSVKKIVIPVIPRVEPCDCIDREDPTDAELIDELVAYCDNLGLKVAEYKHITENYARSFITCLTRAEYDALVAANKVEAGVLYAIVDEGDTIQGIIDNVAEIVSEGIKDGSLAVGTVQDAERAEWANEAGYADNAETAETAETAEMVNGFRLCGNDAEESFSVRGVARLVILSDGENTGEDTWRYYVDFESTPTGGFVERVQTSGKGVPVYLNGRKYADSYLSYEYDSEWGEYRYFLDCCDDGTLQGLVTFEYDVVLEGAAKNDADGNEISKTYRKIGESVLHFTFDEPRYLRKDGVSVALPLFDVTDDPKILGISINGYVNHPTHGETPYFANIHAYRFINLSKGSNAAELGGLMHIPKLGDGVNGLAYTMTATYASGQVWFSTLKPIRADGSEVDWEYNATEITVHLA